MLRLLFKTSRQSKCLPNMLPAAAPAADIRITLLPPDSLGRCPFMGIEPLTEAGHHWIASLSTPVIRDGGPAIIMPAESALRALSASALRSEWR